MASELTTSEDPSLSLAQKSWLINELAKTSNMTELKNRYKRIFGKVVPDVILASLNEEFGSDIAELKACVKTEIDSHELSSPYRRIQEYEKIYNKCMDGIMVGINECGPIIKEDPAQALAALKAIKDEKQTEVQNELKLLQILVQSNRLTTGTGTTTNPDVTAHIEEESSTVVQVESDNDKFFPGS